VRDLLNGFVNPAEREKDRRQREGGFPDPDLMEKGGDTYITNINMGDLESGNITVGKGNLVTQHIENSFNTFPAELQNSLAELINASQPLLQKAEASEHTEEIREELDTLQAEAKKSKPKKERVKITVEGLKKAAQNLNEI